MNSKHFLRNILVLTWKNYKLYAMAFVFACVTAAVIITWPSLVLKNIINNLALGNIEILDSLVLYTGTVLFMSIAYLARGYSAKAFNRRMLLGIKQEMLKTLKKLPVSSFGKLKTTEAISCFMTDIDAVNMLFSAGVIKAAADIFRIAGLTFVLFLLSAELGILAIVLLPFAYAFIDYVKKSIPNRRLKIADPALSIIVINNILRSLIIVFIFLAIAKANGSIFFKGVTIGTLAVAADLFMHMMKPVESIALELKKIRLAFKGIDRAAAYFSQEAEENLISNNCKKK